MRDASILHTVLVERSMDGPNPQPISNHSGNIVLKKGKTGREFNSGKSLVLCDRIAAGCNKDKRESSSEIFNDYTCSRQRVPLLYKVV